MNFQTRQHKSSEKIQPKVRPVEEKIITKLGVKETLLSVIHLATACFYVAPFSGKLEAPVPVNLTLVCFGFFKTSNRCSSFSEAIIAQTFFFRNGYRLSEKKLNDSLISSHYWVCRQFKKRPRGFKNGY